MVDGVPLEEADGEAAPEADAAAVVDEVVLFETDDVGDAAALLEAVFEPEGVPLEPTDADAAPETDTVEVPL